MRVLVSGGAGFIGSHLCDSLIADGQDVVCVDNFITGRRKNIEHLLDNPSFTLVEHDIVNELDDSIRVDRVFHLASPASPVGYMRYPIETHLVNSVGTHNNRSSRAAAVAQGGRPAPALRLQTSGQRAQLGARGDVAAEQDHPGDLAAAHLARERVGDRRAGQRDDDPLTDRLRKRQPGCSAAPSRRAPPAAANTATASSDASMRGGARAG